MIYHPDPVLPMALTTCPDCGHPVSNAALACPHCGSLKTFQRHNRQWIGIILGGMLGFFLLLAFLFVALL